MKAPDALREAALHPRPERILGFERGRLLTLARSLDRLVVHLRPDRALPWGVFRGGAYLAGRTGATGGPVKPDPKHRIAGDIVPGRPLDTRMPLGTVRRLRLPIQDKGLQVIAVCDLMLPAVGPKGRPDHIDPTFKGVWSTVVNFALWPPPDTKPGQYPQHHKQSDDSLGRHALGGWA